MTEFAEPAFAYTHTMHKGNPRWQRVTVLGKTESQDTYVTFTGTKIMLTRSVRRIATLEMPLGVLHPLQLTDMEVQSWIWWEDHPNEAINWDNQQVQLHHKALFFHFLFMTKMQKM